MREAYDYIIVGGGSAGCVLANRLSADEAVRVLVLEAGVRDRHPYIHMPVGFSKLTSGPYTWGFRTVPQRHAGGREIPYAQGKVLGGGSSINAEIFTRGHADDYDSWAEAGASGWGFKDIQPYFLRSEGNRVFSGALHGTAGPLGVSNLQNPQAMSCAFVRACQEYGLGYNADFNGAYQEGCGFYQVTVRDSKRCSAAVGYLRPVLGRGNLSVQTRAEVGRILLENKRAVGVEYRHGGRVKQCFAEAEVVLTSGAIGSPKLLMLSGIGDAVHLKSVGVEVAHHLPGVGLNLNDHFGIDIIAELKGDYSLDKYRKPHWMLWAGLEYLLFRSGPVASNVVEGGAFWYSDKAQSKPDLQFHFLPGVGAEEGVASVAEGRSGITLNSYNMRPKARGTVRLRSSNPGDMPLVDPNFLGHADDIKISAEGVRVSVEMFRQSSLARFIKAMRFPDESVKTQKQYEDFARQYGRTSYHPVGTCKMGVDDLAVVAPDLRVRGLEGLRVCDSSVMPHLIGSNTNAPTIMIGEKAADLIRGGG